MEVALLRCHYAEALNGKLLRQWLAPKARSPAPRTIGDGCETAHARRLRRPRSRRSSADPACSTGSTTLVERKPGIGLLRSDLQRAHALCSEVSKGSILLAAVALDAWARRSRS